MDREDFKKNVADVAAFLQALRTQIPKRVDPELITYLERLQNDPAGLDVLQAAIAPKK